MVKIICKCIVEIGTLEHNSNNSNNNNNRLRLTPRLFCFNDEAIQKKYRHLLKYQVVRKKRVLEKLNFFRVLEKDTIGKC